MFQHWVASLYSELSYGHIVLLMSLEASLFPVPSALVVLPGGYMARLGELNPFLVWLSGATGVFIGACINYILARTIGRTLVIKYGPYILITDDRYHRAERIFLRNAWVALSFGRLMPIINRALPLPAGVFKMNVLSFAVATFAGAAMHALFWFSLGYYLGDSAIPFLKTHSVQFAVFFFGLPIVAIVILILYRMILSRRRVGAGQATPTVAEAAAD